MVVEVMSTKLRKSLIPSLLCFAIIASAILLPVKKVVAQDDENLVIMSPSRQQYTILRDLLTAYREYTGGEVKTWDPNRSGKPWNKATDLAARGHNGTDMMLTSRVDWQYRADQEDRDTFDYAPLVKQRVYRGDNLVGGVEYGVIFPKENPSPVVEEFLSFVKGAGRPVLKQPDPYHIVPIDTPIPPYEPTEYQKQAPWESEKPMIWQGVCHMGARRLHTTMLAEWKKAWMQGYNLAQGGTFNTEAALEFAEEHGMMVMGFPDVENEDADSDEHPFIRGVRRARKYPSTRGLYFQNEDHLPRVWRPLYRTKHALENGGDPDETDVEELEMAEAQFRSWLQDKHGSIDTLNDRWNTEYEDWSSVGLPDLPLDWVKQVVEDTGFEIKKVRGSWFKTWLLKLFRDPLRYHAFTKFPRMLDCYRFLRTAWARRYKALEHPSGGHEVLWDEDFENHAQDLQPYLKPREGEEVPGFIYTTKSRPDVFLFREVPEFNAMSYDHPACRMLPTYSQMPVDIQQIAQDKPVWNSEHHLYNHDKSTTKRVRFHLLQTFIAGQFKSSSYNRARTREESRRERHIAATRTRHQLNQAEEALRAFLRARAEADIAVLVTESNRSWNILPEGPDRPELGGAIQAYAHVGALGKQWKYVLNEDVSAEHVTGRLIVKAPWLVRDTIEKINNLPADRDVIVVGEVPTQNEYGEKFPDDLLEQFRSRATVIDGWDELTDEIAPAEGLPDVYQETIMAEAEWWTPVHGRDEFVVPVPRLEVRRARDGDTLYVAVLNHDHHDRYKEPIPWAAGKKIHEYTAHDPALTEIDEKGQIGKIEPRIYGENEKTLFEEKDAKIYKLTPAD